MNEELLFYLRKLARTEPELPVDSDDTIFDICGGNYDDAYYSGFNDGEIFLARKILDKLGIGYE